MQVLEDRAIIELYFARSQDAIAQTQMKFGRYLMKIAMNILSSLPDSEECVNDTYLRAWNAIPPQRPNLLSTFLGRITRNLSIDRLRKARAAKRSSKVQSEEMTAGGQIVTFQGVGYDLSLEEMSECLPSGGRGSEPVDEVSESLDAKELGKAISNYLRTLSDEARRLFIYRYFDMEPLKDSAALLGMSEAKAKTLLFRTRQGLKSYLEKEGYDL